MSKSGRNVFLDVARGLGISLVVFGHNRVLLPGDSKILVIIYSFHVPLFFFLSGVFFKPTRTFKATVTSRLDSLIKPYLVTMLLLGVETVLTGQDTVALHALKTAYGVGDTLNWVALWFLPHFLAITVFAWITIRILPDKNILGIPDRYVVLPVFFVLGIASINYFADHEIVLFNSTTIVHGLPWSIDLLGVSLCYFLIGYYSSARIQNFRISIYLMAAAAVIFASCHYWGNATLDLNERIYDGIILTTVETACGIYLVLCVAYGLSRVKWLENVLSVTGAASLFILIFHDYIQYHTAELLCRHLGPQSSLAGIAAFLMATTIPVLMWMVVKRVDFFALFYLPLKNNRMYGKIIDAISRNHEPA